MRQIGLYADVSTFLEVTSTISFTSKDETLALLFEMELFIFLSSSSLNSFCISFLPRNVILMILNNHSLFIPFSNLIYIIISTYNLLSHFSTWFSSFWFSFLHSGGARGAQAGVVLLSFSKFLLIIKLLFKYKKIYILGI